MGKGHIKAWNRFVSDYSSQRDNSQKQCQLFVPDGCSVLYINGTNFPSGIRELSQLLDEAFGLRPQSQPDPSETELGAVTFIKAQSQSLVLCDSLFLVLECRTNKYYGDILELKAAAVKVFHTLQEHLL